ncbi:SpoIIE family protein phosphatase [Streptomyces sp. NBC_00996]|uniref:SpoIIE family protein phosphatase n=1 Tax=Streptomyces sp. NBC_00996 TaxID=2903710 RepID=UPI00386E3A11|nr:SpoIIE family protein phosphatase [Streptomyces sp. NBC_00996]
MSVPLPGPNGPLGALTVLTTTAGDLQAEVQQLLDAVARWTAERLRFRDPRRLSAPGPQWQSGTQLQEALDEAGIGTWEWDLRTGAVVWDERSARILGIAPEIFDGRIDTWVSLVDPDDLPQVLAYTEDAIRAADQAYGVQYRIHRPDRAVRWVQARGRVVVDQHRNKCRLTGTLQVISDVRSGPAPVGQGLTQVSDAVLDIDGQGRITSINSEGECLLGSADRLVGHVLWEAAPAVPKLGLEGPCRRAGTSGQPVDFEARWPADQRWFRLRVVPAPGGLRVYFTDITNGRRVEAQQAAAVERTVRIADLTHALAAAVTGQDVIDAVTDHVRTLFDAAGVTVWAREGKDFVLLSAVGFSEEFLELISTFSVQSNLPAYQALQNGVPVCVSSAQEYIRGYPRLSELPTRGGREAWAYLPLVTSGRTVGVLCISYARPHTFSSDERTLFTALSGLVAQALERGRLYDAERRRAHELQRGLLPHDLPVLPAVTAAARYLPAGGGIEVGGDWYDVISLSGDRVALVVGDVMGHGLSEAVTMGRLRTAVHTLADLELPADEMFFHLNDLVSALGDDFYATCLYAVYDPTSGNCSILTAGHPPPAVVHPDGGVHFPDLPLNPPLGAASPPFDSGSLELPPGSLLVLYTDGLVESPQRDVDVGMALMARHLGTVPVRAAQARPSAAQLDAMCDSLIGAVLPPEHQAIDDAALLIASVHPFACEDIACWPLPADPKAAGQARGYVRAQLSRWDLEELQMTTELLVSELVGNVVRHAGGPATLRLLRSRTLICEVSDGSPTMPQIRRAADTDEGGRGLQLIAALAERWGARYTPAGKCIWAEQSLAAAP